MSAICRNDYSDGGEIVMPKKPDDNLCVFVSEFDDEAKRFLGRDISREAVLAYILLGKNIGIHPAYAFQDSASMSLILQDAKIFLEGEEVEIILGNSTSTVDYIFDRIEKVRQQGTSNYCTNTELEQYGVFTDEQIRKYCEVFDNHLVARNAIHPIAWSSDHKFRKLVRNDIESVRYIRYGSHLGALIKTGGYNLNSNQTQGLMDEIIDLSEDMSHTFSCDTVTTKLIKNMFNSAATNRINERLHVLHWKAYEGYDVVVPFAHKLEKGEPHPLDSELFWVTLKMFLGDKIVQAFLTKSWGEQLRIARDIKENPLWQKFTSQYIEVVEMLAQFTSLEPDKILSRLKECRPTKGEMVWDIVNKWELTSLSMLLLASSSSIAAILSGPSITNSILAVTGVVGSSLGGSPVKSAKKIIDAVSQGIRQSAEYDTKELKRILENKLDMLR